MAELATERLRRLGREVLTDTLNVTWILFKVMIPVVIVVKILEEMGGVRVMARAMTPVMGLVGLPGTMGIVWATAMLTNLYAAALAFVSLAPTTPMTAAQVTILTCMLLVAHNLPVELRVAQKAGTRLAAMAVIRVGGALVLAMLLNLFYHGTGLLQERSVLLWHAPAVSATLATWAIGQVENLGRIFAIVLALMVLLRVLRWVGVIELVERLLAPVLRILGMTPAATDITVVGMVLGLAYGGGLIIQHATSGEVSKRDVFFSLALMGLCHSLIEDTTLMALLGGHLSGILLARIVFALICTFGMVRLCNRLGGRFFERYLGGQEPRAKSQEVRGKR
jgi:hypothetical protein